MAIDNITVDRGIITGRNHQFISFPEFIIPIYSVRELLRFSPELTNFSKIYNTHYLGSE